MKDNDNDITTMEFLLSLINTANNSSNSVDNIEILISKSYAFLNLTNIFVIDLNYKKNKFVKFAFNTQNINYEFYTSPEVRLTLEDEGIFDTSKRDKNYYKYDFYNFTIKSALIYPVQNKNIANYLVCFEDNNIVREWSNKEKFVANSIVRVFALMLKINIYEENNQKIDAMKRALSNIGIFVDYNVFSSAIVDINKSGLNISGEYSPDLDILTGAYNRIWGISFLNDLLNRIETNNEIFSVCFIDIVNLKNINDKFGQEIGDRTIISLSTIIKNNIRGTDIFCRLGGDEFMLLLPICSEKNAYRVIENIITDIDKLNNSDNSPYAFNISIGVLEANSNVKMSADEIIKFLYHAMDSNTNYRFSD